MNGTREKYAKQGKQLRDVTLNHRPDTAAGASAMIVQADQSLPLIVVSLSLATTFMHSWHRILPRSHHVQAARLLPVENLPQLR